MRGSSETNHISLMKKILSLAHTTKQKLVQLATLHVLNLTRLRSKSNGSSLLACLTEAIPSVCTSETTLIPIYFLSGLKYVPPETEIQSFIIKFELVNLNDFIEKLNII